MRLAAMQDSPMLRILATMAPSTATSRSASAHTIRAALPPSSIEVRSTLSAACRSSTRPTSVDPVNDSLRVRRSASSAETTSPGRSVVTTLTTPGGTPTSSMMRARSSMVSGVCAAGLVIVVQPAASAGAILRAPMANGKFHGVTKTHGPTGFGTVRMRYPPAGAVL